MNRIIVEHGIQKKLEGIFNVSHVTVRRALRGERNNDLSKRIRKAAIENGGVEMQKVEIVK